jgi:hypothetical protein
MSYDCFFCCVSKALALLHLRQDGTLLGRVPMVISVLSGYGWGAWLDAAVVAA